MAKVVHLIIWRNAWVKACFNRYASLSVVFTLTVYLCLRTGGQRSKFVRVGYKASLLTDGVHSTFAKGEPSDIGIQTNHQSWELLQPTKGTFVNRLAVAPLPCG
jgi:hypothetical protein